MPPSPPCHRWNGERKQPTDPKQTLQRHAYSTHVHPGTGRRDLPSSQHKHSSHTRSLHREGCSTVQRESMPISGGLSKKSHWGGVGRRGVCLSAFTALGQICQNSYVSTAYDENWCKGDKKKELRDTAQHKRRMDVKVTLCLRVRTSWHHIY